MKKMIFTGLLATGLALNASASVQPGCKNMVNSLIAKGVETPTAIAEKIFNYEKRVDVILSNNVKNKKSHLERGQFAAAEIQKIQADVKEELGYTGSAAEQYYDCSLTQPLDKALVAANAYNFKNLNFELGAAHVALEKLRKQALAKGNK